MKKFAVIENGTVINLILAETKQLAEDLTIKECIESTEENNLGVGCYWSNEYNKYIIPSPYPSWIFDGNNWNPPIEYPQDSKNYFWNEKSLSWVELEEI